MAARWQRPGGHVVRGGGGRRDAACICAASLAACEPVKVDVFFCSSRNGGKGSIVDRAIRQPGGLLRQGVLFFSLFFLI